MKAKILLVDDSPIVHQMIGAILTESSYEVVHANDGFEAINMTFKEMPDLIILDINMPRINGWQVCRLLKDHQLTQKIPIIIGTSKSSTNTVQDPRSWSNETGANDYFDKDTDEMSAIPKMIEKFIPKDYKPPEHRPSYPPLSEMDVMRYLSSLLDKQLYNDVTHLKLLDERKSAFVANVSHEFKSPLAIIKSNAELMLDGIVGPVPEKMQRPLTAIRQTSMRLIRLVTDLLDLAKIEAGKMAIKSDRINIADLCQEVITSYDVLIAEKKLQVSFENKSTFPFIYGDYDRLTQAIVNVLNNSIKFSNEGGKICVRLSDVDAKLKIDIIDNGPGMSPENLEKIFDKFERVTAEKREGTGLGLPIARDMIVLHQGKIWAESKEGQGSTFSILLPKIPSSTEIK